MRKLVCGCMTAVMVIMLAGCASTTRIMPAAYPTIDIGGFDRDAIAVLDRVEGRSSETRIFGGLFRYVEGKGLGILGFSFFEDEYVQLEQGMEHEAIISNFLGNFLGPNRVVERAYFDALSQNADADFILSPSIKNESINMLIFGHRTATVRGKAIRVKSDGELE